MRFHEDKDSEATMVLKSVENPLDFGIVVTEEDGRISRFLEKPTWGQVFSDTANTGIYLLEESVLEGIPDPRKSEYDFSKELFPKLLGAGRPLYGYVMGEYWEDVGTLEQYAGAQRDVLDGRLRGARLPGTRLRENIYVGSRSQVNEEQLEGPVFIGENARIAPDAYISPYSVVEANAVVSSGARVDHSVVAEGSYIGEGAELLGALVGRSVYVQARARVLERSALGDDVVIGEGATISPDVKIFPHKTVESGANVTQSLIHETMGLRTVFKGGIVKGKFNVDLTPEFFVRLASSFGSALDPGAVVTLGRDASLSAQVAKRAMTSALLGTGVNVRDLRAAHAGVVRHDVLAGKSSAGAHLRAGDDPDDVEILFFSSDATPVPESQQRDIEKFFVREEYRRAYANEVGELIYPGRAVEQYVERLERASDRERISGATIVVDFSGGVAGLVASRAFSRLGINAVVMEGFANANIVGGRSRPGLEESLARVSQIVPMMEAAFGCVVGPTGEDVRFVDDEGKPIPPDVMLACTLDQIQPDKAVLPINLSAGYRALVEKSGGTLEESRAGLGNVALKAAESRADFAGTADGNFIFPNSLPAPDCFVTLARILELFKETPLSKVRAKFGDSFGNVAREKLECPWSEKGRVMRGLAERHGADPDVILTDGVKLHLEDGWVLMLPDPDNPLFYVYAEKGPVNRTDPANGSGSETLLEGYVELVRSLIKQKDPE